jgi:uncharacterized membrane protein YbhN (UPF0104 family)/tRNA A-37 threonylcarbamoyl transferase component Bud32
VLEVVTERPDFAVSDTAEPVYVRTPVTWIRLAGWVAVLGCTMLVLRASGTTPFSDRLKDLLATIPRWIVSTVVSVCQLGFLVPVALGLVSQLVLRRFTRVARMFLAAIICVIGLVVMSKLVGGSVQSLLPPRDDDPTGRSGYGIGAFPATIDLGVIAAWIFVDRGHWSGRWRRVGAVVLALGATARLGVSLADPTTILTAVAMAAAAALVVQVIFGARNTRPHPIALGEALVGLGYQVETVERFAGLPGFGGFVVELRDHRRLFVKITSRDSWAALLPVRVYRAARFRDVGSDRPFQSLRSVVEHEALCALKARSDGVPTPRLEVLAELPPDSMIVAFEADAFQTLRDLDPSRRPPELLTSVWSIVATLQRTHTVHRRLNADSLLVDADGNVLLIEFTAASLGVVSSALSTDVAEVLAATAATLGVREAVDAAVAGIGPAAVAAALPRLQPLALTPATRQAVKASGCIDELREEVQRATGADAVPIAALERIKVGTVLTIAALAVALWTLIPQVVGVGSLWGELRHANLWWAGAALVVSALTYVAAAVAFDGAITEPLPLGPNIGVQMATSIVGVATPVGGFGLAARFLQKRGIDMPTAVAAVGVNAVAGVIVHLTLTGLFVGLAGSSGLGTFARPSWGTIALIGAAVAAAVAAGVAVPWTRSQLRGRLLPATRRSIGSVSEVARHPENMVKLFGGSLAVTLGYVVMLEAAVAAFGAGPAFTSIALVYLIGSAVSSVAPTPGGLGAVEAALIAGLTSAGMAGTAAVGAVIMYRLASFWLPLLPGYGALLVLQRSGDI